MNPEEKKIKEDAAKAAREKADAAHEAAANTPGDEALQDAADQAEDLAIAAQKEADDVVITSPENEDEKDDDKDIDFEKELRDLQGIGKPAPKDAPPARSELEKAKRNLFFNAKRVKELGGDPNEVLQPDPDEEPIVIPPAPKTPEVQDTSNLVTKDDYALEQARKLGRSEAEAKVIMHHYKYTIQKSGDVMKDIENSYLIANKGRIKRSFEEIRRAGFARPAPGGGPGQGARGKDVKAPQLSTSDQATLRRRGYTQKPDGSWEARRYIVRFDATKRDWVTEKKTK